MTATAIFAVIGSLGLFIVVASIVLGDVFEGLFESLDIDVGGGMFSTPVLGSFLAAFGFGAVLVRSSSSAGPALAAGAGAGAGVVLGGIALWITKSLMHMQTDDLVRTDDVVGKSGVVVSAIPAAGLGEISLVHLGQPLKLSARSEKALPYGTEVVVVSVTSASSVVVEAAADFWGRPAPLTQGD
jgi:membrane protein implicated in regulation of membrane protease activity